MQKSARWIQNSTGVAGRGGAHSSATLASKKGVYYLDFSEDYKTCVKNARESVEKESHLSELEKMELAWVEEMKVGTN